MSEIIYRTRPEARQRIREKLGIQVSELRVDKDAMVGKLRPDARYGRVHLYLDATIDEYGRSLIEPVAATEVA